MTNHDATFAGLRERYGLRWIALSRGRRGATLIQADDRSDLDGLKIDVMGNLYAGGPGGVHVYAAEDGSHLGVIETPAFCANFAWGGDDFKTLYMTASTGLYSVPVEIAGLALF